MAITSGDIDFFKSTTSPSIGGTIGTEITDASLHNLFDVVSSGEATSGESEYRCIYVKNSHGTQTLLNAYIWIETNTPSAESTIEIALGDTAVGTGSETAVADEDTAPSLTDSFASPATKGAGKLIGDIPAGEYKAIWIKRTITAGALTTSADNVILKVEGATLP